MSPINCYVCKQDLDQNLFHKNSKMCKSCKKDYMKKRYDANSKEINNRKEISRSKNRQKIKDYSKKYNKDNREKIRLKEITRLYSMEGKIKYCLTEAKHRAKEKQLLCDLDINYLIEIYNNQNGKCALTDLEFKFEKDNMFRIRPFAPSIDRIDNSKGYIKTNIRFVCVIMNLALNQFGENFFSLIANAYIKKHHE